MLVMVSWSWLTPETDFSDLVAGSLQVWDGTLKGLMDCGQTGVSLKGSRTRICTHWYLHGANIVWPQLHGTFPNPPLFGNHHAETWECTFQANIWKDGLFRKELLRANDLIQHSPKNRPDVLLVSPQDDGFAATVVLSPLFSSLEIFQIDAVLGLCWRGSVFWQRENSPRFSSVMALIVHCNTGGGRRGANGCCSNGGFHREGCLPFVHWKQCLLSCFRERTSVKIHKNIT